METIYYINPTYNSNDEQTQFVEHLINQLLYYKLNIELYLCGLWFIARSTQTNILYQSINVCRVCG